MISKRFTIIAVTVLALGLSVRPLPALADPPPPKIDWKQFQDLLDADEDKDSVVGEEMC